MPRFSVIIPVYNTEKYLKKCIDSVLEQTFQDYEIIVVDDSSPDESQKIISSYTEKDARIKNIKHSTNKGTSEARRTAVSNAVGDYCIFLDSDDFLIKESLFALDLLIQEKGPDFIQYRVIHTKDGEILYSEKLALGEKVFETLFVNNRYYSWSVGGKCISTELLKESYTFIPESRITNSEDFLLSYIVAFFAKHYEFCKEATYHYIFHDNNTSSRTLSEKTKYQNWLNNFKIVYSVLLDFQNKHNILQKYSIRKAELLHDWEVINFFLVRTKLSDQQEGFIDLCQTIGVERVFNILIEYYPRKELLRFLPISIKKSPRTIKTVAIFLDNLNIGGIERVALLLAQELIQKGYKVYLFIDSLEYSYISIPSGVIVEQSPKEAFFTFVSQKIQEYQIDVLHIQIHWKERDLLLLIYANFKDVLTICSVHSNVLWMVREGANPVLYHEYYASADLVTVLSQSDKQYLQQTTSTPIVYMPNLLTFDPKTISQSILEEYHVLFIGRFLFPKNPMLAIQSFAQVVKKFPKAKLTMLGDGALFKECQKLIKSLRLSNNVILKGSQKDISSYLQKASLLILPSAYEGFPMVVTEAMSHGVPVLMSDLPYCEHCYCEGVLTFDKNSVDNLSYSIIDLFNNPQKIKVLGCQAKLSVLQYENFKTVDRWLKLLNELSELNFSDELLSIERKLSMSKVNNIYFQEYYESYFQGGRQKPRLDLYCKPRLNKENIKRIVQKMAPENSFQYRMIRKILFLTGKVIEKVINLFEIKY